MKTKTKHTIKLYVENGVWMSQSDNPEWKELFGTDSVPTCYLSSMSAAVVLREIAARNPGCEVVLKNDLFAVKVYNKFEEFWCIEEICDSLKSAQNFAAETKKIDPFARVKIVYPSQEAVDVWLTAGNKIH